MKKQIIGLILMSVLTMTAANAVPVVSTLPATAINSTGVGGTNDYAAGFVWDSTLDFASAELYLGVEGDPAAPLIISLYNSVGGVPGSELLTLSGPGDILAEGLYTYTGSTSLTQGDTYWIVATTGLYSDTSNEYIWFDGTLGDANYVDTVFQRPPDIGWTPSGIVQPAAFRVNGADVAAVPEPGTLVLMGFGMIGLAIARRRRG